MRSIESVFWEIIINEKFSECFSIFNPSPLKTVVMRYVKSSRFCEFIIL